MPPIVMNIIDLIIKHFDKIAGAILSVAFSGYVTYRISRKKRFADASIKFRNEIMMPLRNIYPTISVYMQPDEINNKIKNSIPPIVTAATAFRHHLPFYRKGCFDRATKNYSDTARNTDWNNQIAYSMFSSMQKPDDISPKDKFKHAVDGLLSYAKEK